MKTLVKNLVTGAFVSPSIMEPIVTKRSMAIDIKQFSTIRIESKYASCFVHIVI